ncbi:MAG TPA: hydrogenase [Phycisphaerales bacterium]|nr:hydrogenase [Phycisphaerales bacterium]
MWTDIIMVLLILTNMVVLGTSRLRACIRVVAVQGVALGILPLLHSFEWQLLIFAVLSIILKGIVFPVMLSRTLRQLNVWQEESPYVGYGLSLLMGPFALAFSSWISLRLPLPYTIHSTMLIPVALFTLIVGLFIIVSRKKALTQVLGYLVMENGIYAFGMAIAYHQPMLIELGVLLDVFVGVFVMGIAIFHISRQFDHINTDQLSALRN